MKVQPEAAVVDTLSPRQAKDWQRIFFSRPALFFDRALMGEETGFYFKIADNIVEYTDICNYYVSGKSFPMGRLSYYYYFN